MFPIYKNHILAHMTKGQGNRKEYVVLCSLKLVHRTSYLVIHSFKQLTSNICGPGTKVQMEALHL